MPAPSHPSHPLLRPFALALLGAAACSGAAAQNSLPALNALGEQWVQNAIAQEDGGQSLPLRLEVQVGKLDPRLQLAPCNQVDAYLPAGSKLWGRTRIGLRCVEQGARPWNVFLPVTVQAWGPGWVLATNVNSGETLDASSAVQAEVDWAADLSPILVNPGDWIGQTATRNLMARQVLRQSMVRPAAVFQKGATVKLLSRGAGFVVTSSGKAVTGAGVGETVKVRMDNGQLVSGTVNAQGDVEVGP
ncbi:MAG: flagellar basal body P-ring formation chaperone FlgA [Comamonas sp.]|nr:flagellar basal body P-ring formation chaperone FlgA [Comamonas sp.]